MKFKTIFKSLIIFCAFIQICCKKEEKKNVSITEQTKLVNIDVAYQSDEVLNDDEKLEVKSVIHYSNQFNSAKNWQYDKNVTQGALRKFNQLSNGNIVFFMEEGDGNYNYSPFVLVLDKNGKEIFKQNIEDKNSKYDFYNPLAVENSNENLILYVKKEIKSDNESAEDAESKMRNSLAKFQIEKMTFKNLKSPYTSVSKSMEDIFFNTLQQKDFTYLSNGNFLLQNIKDKIMISGTVLKANESQIPFVAVLDQNLKLLKFNTFETYSRTDITNISLNSNDTFYIEGFENEASDGTYTSTNKRFIVDQNLKLIKDESDSKPFSSVYRGPSALDPDAEEDQESASEENGSHSDSNHKNEEKGNVSIFYSDRVENSYYSIKEEFINSSEIVFEKAKIADSTALWQIKFVFPSNYEIPYSTSTDGFKRRNGDFIFSLFLRDKSIKNSPLSVAIFVFNKEGRLIRQFETPAYFGLTDFKMKEFNGKLITGFISYDANYINNDWRYPHVFRSISYSLE